MNEETLQPPERFPDVLIDSLRKGYPHPRNKPNECKALRAALHRLMDGEVNGVPRSPQECAEYLRSRLEAARRSFLGREKRYTPHLTTWLNQRRYLAIGEAAAGLDEKNKMEDAYNILALYPDAKVTPNNIDAYMPLLRIIDSQILALRATMGEDAPRFLQGRVALFAERVREWPPEERAWIPGAKRFFEEERWNQDERAWVRTSRPGYQAERQQLARIR